MRYELTDFEWAAIRPFLSNKSRGVPRVNDRRVLFGGVEVLERGSFYESCPYVAYAAIDELPALKQHGHMRNSILPDYEKFALEG